MQRTTPIMMSHVTDQVTANSAPSLISHVKPRIFDYVMQTISVITTDAGVNKENVVPA